MEEPTDMCQRGWTAATSGFCTVTLLAKQISDLCVINETVMLRQPISPHKVTFTR